MRICQECNAEYERKVVWQKYCSDGCKFIAFGKKQKYKLKKEALKEANKVMRKK